MAVSEGYSDGDDDDDEDSFAEPDETTPVCAQRAIVSCLPCRGGGAIAVLTVAVLTGRRETIWLCPVCRGAGTRIILLRRGREVALADEKDAMNSVDLGRCKGAFRAGRRAAFGRVACLACGGRFRPLPGLRVPNHIAQRKPSKDSAG